MQIEEIYISLIIRYLKKEISEEEQEKLFHWIYENNENENFFYHLKDIWETARYESIAKGAETDAEWEKLALVAVKEETGHFRKKKSVTRTLYHVIQIAAIVIVMFFIGFIVQKYLPEEEQFTSLKVPYGAKSKLELPDGSMIWVNSGSVVKYPVRFDDKEVNIFLDGEAYFDIVKNPKRALNVKTSTINIQVHGTTFNVKSYANDDAVETTLLEGSISISGKVGPRVIKKPIFLKPNEQALLIKSKETVNVEKIYNNKASTHQEENTATKPEPAAQPKLEITKGIDTNEFIMWKNNVLVFKNERFEDLAVKLERWYNVEIIIKDKALNNSRFTGTFDKENIEQAMKALNMSSPFKYTINKNQITIIKKQ